MKTYRRILAGMFLVLAGSAVPVYAEDIDLYSRVPSPKNNPNVLIILDNAANSDNAASTCNYDVQPGDGLGGPSAMGASVFGNEQCALYNVVNALPTGPGGIATVNLGIMVYNATGLDVAMGLASGTCPGGNGGCLIQPLTAMTSANKTTLLAFIKSWTKANIKANSEATASAMQEAWAYFAGQVGISGRDYSLMPASQRPLPSCVNNYVAFIGNAYNSAGSPGDPASPSVSTALTSAYAWAQSGWTAAGGTASGAPQPPAYPGPLTIPSGNYGMPPANNSCGAYTMGSHTDPSGLYADEWARFMHTTNLYYKPIGNNTITTYGIAVIGSACKPDYPALLTSMARAGGGQYFVASNATNIYQAILRILNEVQAVNSVFASASLPVSVNAQGTYLNQVYIAMFRPDQGGNPRWYGNLKQYQIMFDPVTRTPSLGDAAYAQAVAPTGTFDPSASSFWTCANASQLSAASALLGPADGQWALNGPGYIPLCANDPGFWLNNPNGIGGAFDMPDGDVVEKGGHAQVLRLSNLSVNYTSPPGSSTNPRNLYTYCPGGGCIGTAVPLSNYPFDVSNTSITDAMLAVQSVPILSITSAATVAGAGANSGGRTATTGPVTVSIKTLSKTGSVVTATVTPASDVGAKLYVGAQLKMATGTTKYDCTPYCVVTGINTAAGTFTYTNSGGGGNPTLPTTATLATNYFWIWSPGNTMQLGQTLTISGCTSPNFTVLNGTVATVVVNPAYNTLPSSGFLDLAVVTPVLNSATSDLGCSYTPNTATVTTASPHGFPTGATIGISGAVPAGYNGMWPITVTANNQFTYQYAVPAPLASFSGTGTLASATSGTTTRDLLMRWIRGEDNYGDEASLCPPGVPAGVNGCPNPIVNIRPSVHGDVLHSRPAVINYSGTIVKITSTTDVGTTRTATASTTDIAALNALATTTAGVVPVTFSTSQICAVTITSSTTITYSTACGVPGAQAISAGADDVVVYYGGNDGVVRAINGKQPNFVYIDPATRNKIAINEPNAGKELWGFIPPEFYAQFKRLHDNSPVLALPTTPAGIVPTPQHKDYFADGSPTYYQQLDASGATTRAILYMPMRRGGRFMYALDVTDPKIPKFLWKHSSTDAGFSELGQTWSVLKPARVKGWANPVLIFGGGYSPKEDSEAPGTDDMGRGIFVVDAITGNPVWSACPAGCTLNVPGMTYSIPADLAVMDRSYNDGLIDRIYATDVGGNVWRVDLEPPKTNLAGVACSAASPTGCTPDIWQVEKLAALGCNTGVCAAGTTPRKFLFPVAVIATRTTDYVFVASGDREHPLYTDPTSTAAAPNPYPVSPPYSVSAYAVVNRAYLLKDTKTGLDGSGQAVITEGSLFDCTNCTAASPYPGTMSGYYETMAQGEKSVNAPLVVAGLVYFGTNQAQKPNPNQCEEGLGEATGYYLDPYTGALGSTEFENGGLPPSPVAGAVNVVDPVTGKVYQIGFCMGCGNGKDDGSWIPPTTPKQNIKSSRRRPYWYRTNK